jgi:chromosomal replication initiation ATPase DnaA
MRPDYNWDVPMKSNPQVIKQLVLDEFGISELGLFSICKARHFSDARKAYWYLMRKYTSLKLNTISDKSGRHHSSIVKAIQKLEDWISVNDPIVKKIERIESKLLTINK